MGVKELYEEFSFPLVGNHDHFMERYIFPNVPGYPKKILDAGCGTGNLSLELARKFPRAQIIGIDFSENSIAQAQRSAREHHLTNVEFRYGDLMTDVPLQESERIYDFVMSIGCLHHTPDPGLCLRHLRRVIASEGLLIMSVYGMYGRIETELRRKLMLLFRQATRKSNRELMSLCKQVISEPALIMNSFSKPRFSMALGSMMARQDLSGFTSWVVRAVLSKLRNGGSNHSESPDIGLADQYLHPLVHHWTAKQWIETIESNGFQVARFIYDPFPRGWCIPQDPLDKIKSYEIRDLLGKMAPNEQYEALDLIFRPGTRIIACKPS